MTNNKMRTKEQPNIMSDVLLCLASSPNDISWICKFPDGVSVATNLQWNLCYSLNDTYASPMRSRHLIYNTAFLSQDGYIYFHPRK